MFTVRGRDDFNTVLRGWMKEEEEGVDADFTDNPRKGIVIRRLLLE